MPVASEMEELDEMGLTIEERQQARQHWDALMFACCPIDREKARLALNQASAIVQHKVISDITQRWLAEEEPVKEDNPFLPVSNEKE